MLSFQLVNSSKGIQIFCDDEGAEILRNALNKIKPDGGHVHLLSLRNGGKTLSDKTPFYEDAIGEVIVTWAGE